MLPAAASQRRGEHVAASPSSTDQDRSVFVSKTRLHSRCFVLKSSLVPRLSLFFKTREKGEGFEGGGFSNPSLLLLRGNDEDPLFRK